MVDISFITIGDDGTVALQQDNGPQILRQRFGRCGATLSPATRIYLHSLLPFDSSYYYTSLEGKEQDVVTINRILHDAADSHNYTYIELYKHFVRPKTCLLDAAYTTDGLHLNGQGYNLWAQLLQPYINE